MLKLLLLFVILLDLSPESVLGLECRHGVSTHFVRSKKTTVKTEDYITCENEDQVCARVHVKGMLRNNNRVLMHAASCMNETLCDDEELCSIENLVNMTDVGPFSKVHSCKTKCCNEDHCNTHTQTRNKQPPPEKLQCFDGSRNYDAEGNLIGDDVILKRKTCKHSAKGTSNPNGTSRCVFMKFTSKNLLSNSTILSTLASCSFTSMCEGDYTMCKQTGDGMSSSGVFSLTSCNLTCCSTPYCNAVPSMVLSSATIFCTLLSLYFLHN